MNLILKEINDLLYIQKELFDKILLCEKAMIEFYKPEKINIASFTNYLLRVHFHVIARFKEDVFPRMHVGETTKRSKGFKISKF